MGGADGSTLVVCLGGPPVPSTGPSLTPVAAAPPNQHTPSPSLQPRISIMTMDKSLRVRKGSSAARGVLSRAERIVKLKEQERWGEGRSPLGLPKVRVYKMAMKKKKKAKEDGADAAAGKAPAGKAGAKKK